MTALPVVSAVTGGQPSKEDALRAVALIEDVWEMAPDLPYTKTLRHFIEATALDAARYRWLREAYTTGPEDNYKPWCARVAGDGLGNELLYEDELDDAVDAAMCASHEQGTPS